MAAVVVVAGLVLWGKYKAAKAIANRDAVTAIWSLDGQLQYEWMVSGDQSKFLRAVRHWIGDEYVSTVRSIAFEGTRVTDESVGSFVARHSESLQEVTEITFRDCSITGKTLTHLMSLPNIVVLRVEDTNIADGDLPKLLGFRRLRELTLVNPPPKPLGYALDRGSLSISGARQLSTHPSLESLTLHRFVLSDGNINYIRDFDLETLSIFNHSSGFCEVTDDGVKHLEGIEFIKDIDLAGTGITDASMPILATLVNLRSLSLLLTSVTSDGLSDIGSLEKLQSLTVNSPYLTDDCLRHLKGMPNLITLSLPGRPTLSPELQAIREEFSNELDDETLLAQSGVTVEAVKQFKKSHAPNLTFRLH